MSFTEILYNKLLPLAFSILISTPSISHLSIWKNRPPIFQYILIHLFTLLALGILEILKIGLYSKVNLRVKKTSKLLKMLIKVFPPTTRISIVKAESCPKYKEKTPEKPTQSLSTLFREFSKNHKFKNLILYNKW